jgi:NADH pyrophosphatase NudC (nudix superfamily)
VLTTIAGIVVVLCAAIYVAWPLLAPGEPAEAAAGVEGSDQRSPETEKDLALHAIKEAEFDHETGKLSDEDYAVLRTELESRALQALSDIDAASALHAVAPIAASGAPGAAAARTTGAEPAGFCPTCGTRFARGARYCPGCGKKLPAGKERGRRRA